jgi:DNA-binding transcriptional ArsR family regulator
MDDASALRALAALAQPTRLNVFRRLVKAHPDGMPAGEIARSLGVPHNTMSTHLAILARAGLVTSSRDGRIVTFRAELEAFRGLVAFLVHDCCDGAPEVCAGLLPKPCCEPSPA